MMAQLRPGRDGMLVWQKLDFTGTSTSVKKLCQTVCCGCCLPPKDPQILSNLQGWLERGEFVALMGPSGAGKSSLLNCVTQGRTYKGCNGFIKVCGISEPVRASFINQDEKDHLLLSLTVTESLRYASELKNPPKMSDAQHDQNVQKLMEDLHLKKCKDTRVDKCSGGQKKRLAIGLELTPLEKPHFLFLDEPTSGLDSNVSFKVAELLNKLATGNQNQDQKIGIMATIHQPSFKLLQQFTRVYVICKGGNFIFNGPPINLKPHLEGFQIHIEEDNNPADVVIDVGSVSNEDDINDLAKCGKMIEEFEKGQTDHLYPVGGKEVQNNGIFHYGAEFNFCRLWSLFQRCVTTSLWNQKRFILIRLALHMVVAGVLAALYSRDIGLEDSCILMDPRLDPKNCSCVESQEELLSESIASQNVKFHFFGLLFLMFAALMPTVLTFPAEIKLFLNEYRNGWYSSTTYYVSKTLVEIPLQFLFPVCYTYFLYWYTQQAGMDEWYQGLFGFMTTRYRYFVIVTLLCCFIAQGLGILIGIVCVHSFNITIILSSSTLLFLFLFSGFFVKRISMGDHVEWITTLSFVRFGFESLLIDVYGRDRCNGTIGEVSSVLFTFNLKDDQLNKNIVWLVVHLVVIRVLAFFVLKYIADPMFLRFEMKSFSKGISFLMSSWK